MNDLFSDAVDHLLTDHCTPAAVRAIEAGGSAATLWQYLDDAGFADALVPEAHGGAGLSLAEVYPVLALCGTHSVPVPLGETMLARALLVQAGLAVPKGSITLAQARRGTVAGAASDDSLVCDAVPGGRVADWVVVAHGEQAYLLPVLAATAQASSFVLDASLAWSAEVVAAAPRWPTALDVRLLQACINAAQLSGALMAVFNRTLQYANDRIQFGRPIGKFQAIQHQLSVMAEHAFAARMAAQLGCRAATGSPNQPDRLQVAIAKARTSEAALEVAGLSHSIHGAIGFTQEFDLQLFTRRLHHWRQAGGSESYWHGVAGAALVDHHQGLALDLIRIATDTATDNPDPHALTLLPAPAQSALQLGCAGRWGAWLLPRAVGLSKVGEMAFTGESLLALSAGYQAIAHNTAAHKEAVLSFVEKRAPKFED